MVKITDEFLDAAANYYIKFKLKDTMTFETFIKRLIERVEWKIKKIHYLNKKNK